MDWSKVAKSFVSHGLDLLASAIPGGPIVSRLVSDVLGCDDEPEAIDKALKGASDETLLKLKELEKDKELELRRAELQVVKSVNQTMRVEAKSDKWYVASWRPFIGYSYGLMNVMIIAMFLLAVWRKDYETLGLLPNVVMATSGILMGMAGVLGVTAYTRGKEKQMRINPDCSSTLGAFLKR